MTAYARVPFLEAVRDATGGNPKVQRKEYLPEGPVPVLDQGQGFIAGYTTMDNAYAGQLPVVLFGDHTRTFKYVDFSFALGADGVKVLLPQEGFEASFLYYHFRNVHIPSAGYSRHFKFLRELSVYKPPLSEQRRIVGILNRAAKIERLRARAQERLREFVPALFVRMFGDPVENPMGWRQRYLGEVCEIQGGLQVSKKRTVHPLEAPYLRVANVLRDRLVLQEIKRIHLTENELDRVRLQPGDLLIVEGHGNADEIGRVAVWNASIEPCVHQNHLIRARPCPSSILPEFACAYLNSTSGRRHLLLRGKTTSGLNTITTSDVKACAISVPPLDLQRRYTQIVDAARAAATMAKAGSTTASALNDSLMFRLLEADA